MTRIYDLQNDHDKYLLEESMLADGDDGDSLRVHYDEELDGWQARWDGEEQILHVGAFAFARFEGRKQEESLHLAPAANATTTRFVSGVFRFYDKLVPFVAAHKDGTTLLFSASTIRRVVGDTEPLRELAVARHVQLQEDFVAVDEAVAVFPDYEQALRAMEAEVLRIGRDTVAEN